MGKKIKGVLLVVIGTILIAAATGMFYNPNKMIVGGFAGIGIIIESLSTQYLGFKIPVGTTNIVLNIPLLILALRFRGKGFVIKTFLATTLFSVATDFCAGLPKYTGDMMLVSIYGGICHGAGLGCVLLGRGSTGGVDLLSSLIHRVIRYVSISKIIFVIDVIIIGAGLYVFGADNTMYGILSIFISTKVSALLLEGLNYSKAAFIISQKADVIANEIMEKLDRGVTGLEGKGMYTGAHKDVLLCVFAQKEIALVKDIVNEIDKDAFVLVTDVREVLGNGFRELTND